MNKCFNCSIKFTKKSGYGSITIEAGENTLTELYKAEFCLNPTCIKKASEQSIKYLSDNIPRDA
jgi:hypothetical protein